MTENLPILTDEYCIKQFGWTKSQFEVVRNTYFKGLSIDDITIFAHVCKHTRLDPFLKQIYPVVRSGKMTIQTAIDGYRAIAERTGRYSPGREPTFVYGKDGLPLSATAYVKKMTADGTWHEVAATAHFMEYNPGVGPFWKKMPHTMISKCAEALALRKAFPAELSGVLTKEEMDQAGPEDTDSLPQAECQDVTKPNKPCPKLDEPAQSMTVDTKICQDKSDTKICQESLDILLDTMSQVDEECSTNFLKWMQDKYGSKNPSDLPQSMFDAVMRGFSNNILKQKQVKVV